MAAASTLLGVGCKDTSNERDRLRALAEPCTINSDCDDPLVCAFERCHEECTRDHDCDAEQRCVMSDVVGIRVCQLPDDVDCVRDKDCWGDQVCGIDDECRDACTTALECTPEQICANSGECASSLLEKDVVDPEGNIVVEGATGTTGSTGATAGTTSDSVAGASEPSPDEGEPQELEDSGSGSAETGWVRDESTGASSTTSAGDSSGSDANEVGSGDAAGASTGEGTSSEAEFVETEDGSIDAGDVRESPTPLERSASILVSSEDEDWFSVVVPDDGRGRVLSLTVAQEVASRLQVHVYAGADDSLIGGTSFAIGATSSVFATVGSGTTTLIQVRVYGVVSAAAELTLDVAAERDDHEPNQSLLEAREISPNSTITAQILIPWTSDAERASDDWFRVELGSGATTVELESIPADTRMHVYVYDVDGLEVDHLTTAAGQIRGSLDLGTLGAGTYYAHFSAYEAAGINAFASTTIPGYMADTYSFRVAQTP